MLFLCKLVFFKFNFLHEKKGGLICNKPPSPQLQNGLFSQGLAMPSTQWLPKCSIAHSMSLLNKFCYWFFFAYTNSWRIRALGLRQTHMQILEHSMGFNIIPTRFMRTGIQNLSTRVSYAISYSYHFLITVKNPAFMKLKKELYLSLFKNYLLLSITTLAKLHIPAGSFYTFL